MGDLPLGSRILFVLIVVGGILLAALSFPYAKWNGRRECAQAYAATRTRADSLSTDRRVAFSGNKGSGGPITCAELQRLS
jgi:hypothetical protein